MGTCERWVSQGKTLPGRESIRAWSEIKHFFNKSKNIRSARFGRTTCRSLLFFAHFQIRVSPGSQQGQHARNRQQPIIPKKTHGSPRRQDGPVKVMTLRCR
jgi:hypothetical protein